MLDFYLVDPFQVARLANLPQDYKVWKMLSSLLADLRTISIRETLSIDTACRSETKRDRLNGRQDGGPHVGLDRLRPRSRSHSHSPLSRGVVKESGGISKLRQSHSRGPSADLQEIRELSPPTRPSDFALPVTALHMDLEFPSDGSSNEFDHESSISSSSSSDSESDLLPASVLASVHLPPRRSFNSSFRPFIQPPSHLGSRRPSPSSNLTRPTLTLKDTKASTLTNPVESDSEEEDEADGPYGPYGIESITSNSTVTPFNPTVLSTPRNNTESTPLPTTKPKITSSKADSFRTEVTPAVSPMLTAQLEEPRTGSNSAHLPVPLKTQERNDRVVGEGGIRDVGLINQWFMELHQQRLQSVREWIEGYLQMVSLMARMDDQALG